jgi:endonuclease/exonuclease/phosphatase (EEP) superfamily protein YafD
MGPLRVAIRLLLWLATLALALASAAGAIAAQLGRGNLDFDALAHFAPLFLAGAAAALILSFLHRGWARWLAILPALAGIAAAGALIAPEFLRSTGPKAPAGAPGQVKLVQFNVWIANRDPQATLAWLNREDPDIAVIEEASLAFRSALRADGRWRVACGRCKVIILSKAAPADADPVWHRERSRRAPIAYAEFRDAQGPFEVIGVHHAWPFDADQPRQEARLAQAIGEADRRRVIVAGDFNSAPWSFARRRWDAAFAIPRRDRAVASWPARSYGWLRWFGTPFLPIDHVYAGPGWGTVSVRRGPRLGSDHYPLVVTLAPIAPR